MTLTAVSRLRHRIAKRRLSLEIVAVKMFPYQFQRNRDDRVTISKHFLDMRKNRKWHKGKP